MSDCIKCQSTGTVTIVQKLTAASAGLARSQSSSWLVDFLNDGAGTADNPFEPAGGMEIVIPGNGNGGKK